MKADEAGVCDYTYQHRGRIEFKFAGGAYKPSHVLLKRRTVLYSTIWIHYRRFTSVPWQVNMFRHRKMMVSRHVMTVAQMPFTISSRV